MSESNYKKNNGAYNNSYDGVNDYYNYPNNDYNASDYYNAGENYTVPMDMDMSSGKSYDNKDEINPFDQGRFGRKDYEYNNQNYYADYMNNEYNYYDGDFQYADQYSIDYGNDKQGFGSGDYDYSEYGNGGYDIGFESSLYEISNKLSENLENEMLYSNIINNNKEGGGPYAHNTNAYDNVTAAVDVNRYNSEKNYMPKDDYNQSYDQRNYGRNDYNDLNSSRYERESLYNSSYNDDRYSRIDSRPDFYNRNGAYDNKLIPTQDIVFEDAYVVRNQLFEDEDKLFTFNDLISFLMCIVFAVILAFLITRFVAQLTTVDGESMTHNLQNKDELLVDKFSYKIRKPKRYEIVIFPVDNDKFYIKRIIGLPGEKIDVQDCKVDSEGNIVTKSKVYINGVEKTDEIYGYQDINGTAGTNAHCTLGEDEYYVMGDNRNNSNDSRNIDLGPIKGSDFIGRAVFRIFPLTSFGPIDNQVNEKIYNGDEQLKLKYGVQ